ncbi:polysaccharide deacetylase family protein [Streptomyces sp. DT171]|uniref:polysaccharide deacetylase family protein n=1 Tax=Streptomyces sp. DT171 TaxID=3416524 RepID=UPI003CF41544
MTAGRGAAAVVVPVLLYHAVMEDPPDWIAEFTVRPRDFAAHLDLIESSGRTPVPVGVLADALAGRPGGRAPLPARPLVLTFDDGFADLPGPTAEALAARSMPGTAYLTTGALVRSPHVGAGPTTGRGGARGSLLPPAPMMRLDRAPLLERYGIEVGAHTVTHPQLDTLPAAALRRELGDSKAELEDVLEHEVVHLAYPHGYSSPAVRRAARTAGYRSAVAVRHALSSTDDEPYRIARLILRRGHTVADVEAWLSGVGAAVAPFPDALPTVGWRLCRRARAALRGPVFAG